MPSIVKIVRFVGSKCVRAEEQKVKDRVRPKNAIQRGLWTPVYRSHIWHDPVSPGQNKTSSYMQLLLLKLAKYIYEFFSDFIVLFVF